MDSTLVSTGKTGDGPTAIPRRLMIGTGQTVTTHLIPDEGVVMVGRAPEATIRVDDASVSRLHVRIHLGGDVLRVEDLGSANGSRIGGQKLPPNTPTILPPGQVLEIGSSWLMVANSPLAASITRASADPTEASGPGREADGLIVRDPSMRELHRLIERIALSDISVLLYGDTGVGKEVFARRIHTLSPRAGKPFLGLNCAALAATLLESELFGYERGAFTGAVATKPGLLETAEGGTILLDEIGEMPTAIQVKLLRVLEERQVLRIGGTKARPIDVRVLSATNRHLETAIDEGSFRRDLYFRLNGITVEIPSLRDRPSEIEPLARRFADLAARRLGAPSSPEIDPAVWERLRRYQWPGNIRQLRNVMERAVVLSEGGPITVDDLPVDTYVGPGPRSATVEMPLSAAPSSAPPDDGERARILAALEQCAGNQTRAAEQLGISRRTLVSRLSEYNVPRPRKRGV
jgi:transcriptional regulator with PAS, ATPase and Fis domain